MLVFPIIIFDASEKFEIYNKVCEPLRRELDECRIFDQGTKRGMFDCFVGSCFIFIQKKKKNTIKKQNKKK
jgi:hypothetical protein